MQDTHTGTPQGGILSPLLANIALSVLDEHLHAAVAARRGHVHPSQRERRRRQGPAELANRQVRGRFRGARAR